MAYADTTDKKKLSKKAEQERLSDLDDMFQEALDDPSWREARDNEMVKCFDYKENRQWTAAELNALKEGGQPPTVNNRVKVTIDRIVGQFCQVRTRTAFKPRNQAPDTDLAQAMEDIFSYIKQQSGLPFEERECLEDGVTGGFGVLDVCIEDGEDNKADQEVLVKAEDCFNIFPDPRSKRYDWNQDARFIHRAKWVDADLLKELYPSKASKIKSLLGSGDPAGASSSTTDELKGDNTPFLDYKRERIRLIETQYKKYVDEETYVFSDGKTIPGDQVDEKLLEMAKAAGITYEIKSERNERICKDVWTSGILFSAGVSKRKRYSFVPFFTNRKKNGAPISNIFISLPIQDEMNKRQSKSLALLTLNQATYERGAIDDKSELSVQMIKPDGQIELNEGHFEKFKLDKNLELAQSQNQMFLQNVQSYSMVTGVNPDAMGEKSEVRSGVGIQRKIAMTGLVIAPIFDNFRRTREALAKTIHDAVRVAYTEKKILNITDNPKASRVVALDENALDAVKQAQYDVIVTEEEDYDTVHEQQMDIIAKNLPQMLQYGPGWAEVLLELSTIRNKQEILAKVKQVSAENAPKPEPSVSVSGAFDKMSLPEKVFHYQRLGMSDMLLQQLIQENLPPTQVIQAEQQGRKDDIEAQAEVAKTEQASRTEAMKAQTEQQKMVAAREKAQMDIQKLEMDIQAKREELELKKQEMALKLQGEQQKMQLQAQQMAMKSQMEQQKGAIQMSQMEQQGAIQREQGEMQLSQAKQQHKMDMKAKKSDIDGKSKLMKQKAQAKPNAK